MGIYNYDPASFVWEIFKDIPKGQYTTNCCQSEPDVKTESKPDVRWEAKISTSKGDQTHRLKAPYKEAALNLINYRLRITHELDWWKINSIRRIYNGTGT